MKASDARIVWGARRSFASSLAIISYLLIFVLIVSAESVIVIPGHADRIFDKAFLQSVKNVQLYNQVVAIVGVPGVEVAVSSIKIPGLKYHWKGRNNSFFNVTVRSGKIVDADVVTPDGHILTLDDHGEVIDFEK